LIGFGALPLRCLLFAYAPDPSFVVFEPVLDGISAAALGVMVPLVVADISRDTGRFNLAQGVIGTAVGIGAALSTSLGGYVSDHSGRQAAFLDLAAIAACGFAFVLSVMPETRPR
jgi:MFS family permease